MSKDDIDKAVKEAEQYAAEDKKRRENVDLRNGADQMVYTTEKMIAEAGDKLDDSEKTDITNAIEALKEALKGEDMDAIKAKQDELQQKVYAASEKLYKAAAEQAQAAQGAEQANADPNVYDAEFTEDNGDNQ